MPDELANGLSSINLYNVEPGQAKKVTVNYMNNGDLAFKAGGALKLEYDTTNNKLKSYTGLETLNQQINPDAKVGTYKNNYAVNVKSGINQTFYYYMYETTGTGSTGDYLVILDVYFDTNNYETAVMKAIEYKSCSGEGMDEDKIIAFCEDCVGNKKDYVSSIPSTDTDEYIIAIRNALLGAYNNLSGVTSTTPIELEVYDTINPKFISQGIDADGAEYEYYSVNKSNMDKTQYEKRFKKLLAMQGVEINDPSTTTLNHVQKYEFDGDGNPTNTSDHLNYYDNGGHLEDVLEVYVGVPSEVEHTVFENKDSQYYFGNLHEFTFLMENGPTADPDFDYDSYADDPETKLAEINAKFAEKAKAEGEGAPYTDAIYPEEEYMYLYQDVNANLNEDYQNYLTNAGGYCIPKDVISNNGVVPSKEGVKVKIYDKDNNETEQLASEIGSCDFVIYMPTDADSRYQNASISLQLGVTATQAEFEMDDTGYMVYDKFGAGNSNKVTKNSLLKITNGDVDELYRVLDVKNNYVTVARMPNENDYKDLVDEYGKIMDYFTQNTPYVVSYYQNDGAVKTFEDSNVTNKLGREGSYIQYSGSNLDTMCQYYYENCIQNSSLKSSIISQEFAQSGYSAESFSLDDPIEKGDNIIYLFGDNQLKIEKLCSDESIPRKVRSLAFSDIVNCLGNSFDSNMLFKFITNFDMRDAKADPGFKASFNANNKQNIGLPLPIWLADACDSESVFSATNTINLTNIIDFDTKNGICSLVSFVFTFDNSKFDDYEVVDEWSDMYTEKNVNIILNSDESANPESMNNYINKYFVNSPINDVYKVNFNYDYIYNNQTNGTDNPTQIQNSYIDAAVLAKKDFIVFEFTEYSDVDHLAEVINANKDIIFISFCSARSVALDEKIASVDYPLTQHYFSFSNGSNDAYETEVSFIYSAFDEEEVTTNPINSDFYYVNKNSLDSADTSKTFSLFAMKNVWEGHIYGGNGVTIQNATYCNNNTIEHLNDDSPNFGDKLKTSSNAIVIISNCAEYLNTVAQFCKTNEITGVRYFNINGYCSDNYDLTLYEDSYLYTRSMDNEELSKFIISTVKSLCTNSPYVQIDVGLNKFIQKRVYPLVPIGK